jgi:hypothetical protein
MIVGLDVDNVIYPFSEEFTTYAELIHNLPTGSLDPEAHSWAWYKAQWGWDTETFLRTYVEAVKRGMWLGAEPRPGAVFNARKLDEAGYRIEYVTDRVVLGPDASIPEHVAFDQTKTWLDLWGFPQSRNLTITGDKASVQTHVFLDDKIENIEALKAAGRRWVALWGQPHNRHIIGHARMTSWAQFRRFVAGADEVRAQGIASRAWDVVA